jgi:predicted AlkP superfamily phosphohydrolase/phosphomutase
MGRQFLYMKLKPFLFIVLLAAGALTLGLAVSPLPTSKDHRAPLLVIGIDGGEWKVIDQLWSEGKLPNLKALAGRGVTASLHTAYNSSPVIWTTIATGVVPEVHGITDFVVATPKGDVPISSEVRKVPALWNMLTRTGRRVAVLGWWGSWPAEDINGVEYSDRALLDLPARVSPPTALPRFLRELREADADPGLFGDGEERRDRVMARAAAHLAGEGYDLILLYFRSTDIVSHFNWKFFEPEKFDDVDPRELAAKRGEVPRIYEAVDQEIGRILAAAPRTANVLVVSDHGFHAAPREDIKAQVNMDAILERLGYLTHKGGAVDFSRTVLYTYATPDFQRSKDLRFALAGREAGGRIRQEERDRIREKFEVDLATVTNDRGEPVFTVREAHPRRGDEGDLVAVVHLASLTPVLRVGGKPFPPALLSLTRISGTHTPSTHGILLAAGPDIDPKADLSEIRVHDLAPTILYGLGLPVAEDFAGQPRMTLFNADFRRAHPLRTIPSWGTRPKGGAARASRADADLLNELRSLGYIR